jgi:hypothetical protein
VILKDGYTLTELIITTPRMTRSITIKTRYGSIVLRNIKGEKKYRVARYLDYIAFLRKRKYEPIRAIIRKRYVLGPVRGSSSVGVGSMTFTSFGGRTDGVGDICVDFDSSVSFITALGLDGAFNTTSQAIFSGLGVTKSWRAAAPSTTVAPDLLIAAITVRVYELASVSISSRLTSTASATSATTVILDVFTVLLSDCFMILSTTLSASIDSEKVIRIFLLSITLTEFIESVFASTACVLIELTNTRSARKSEEKKRVIA